MELYDDQLGAIVSVFQKKKKDHTSFMTFQKKYQVGMDIHGMPVTSHTSSSPNHQADIRVFIYLQDRGIPPPNNGKLPTSIWGGLEPDLLGDVDYRRYLSS